MISHQFLNSVFDSTASLLPSDFTGMLFERFGCEANEPIPIASLPPPEATLIGLMEFSSAELAVLCLHPGFIALCADLEVRKVMELISETSRLYSLGLLVANQYNFTELKLADLMARDFLCTAPLPLHSR